MVNATELPVSADLERGFGDAPRSGCRIIRCATDATLVGCTIEDTAGNLDKPLYDFSLAVEAVSNLDFPFTLTPRAHNLMYSNPSLNETIKRLQAFENAGADVLFAPRLPDLDSVREICTAVTKPVNFMVGNKRKSFSLADLRDSGVKRISLATSLY